MFEQHLCEHERCVDLSQLAAGSVEVFVGCLGVAVSCGEQPGEPCRAGPQQRRSHGRWQVGDELDQPLDRALVAECQRGESGLDIRLATVLVGDLGWAGRDRQRRLQALRRRGRAPAARSRWRRAARRRISLLLLPCKLACRASGSAVVPRCRRGPLGRGRAPAGRRAAGCRYRRAAPSPVSSGSSSQRPIATLAVAISTAQHAAPIAVTAGFGEREARLGYGDRLGETVALQRHVGEVVVNDAAPGRSVRVRARVRARAAGARSPPPSVPACRGRG